jgi:hypothetical protein
LIATGDNMKVRIFNCPDKDFKPFVERAVNFYAQNLIHSKRLRDNIYLTVKFNPKLTVWALASIEEYNASNKAREFMIEVHPWLGAAEILKTLAHEMVHIKQFAHGETNETLSKWKGISIDADAIDYYQHPWELEAYSLETGLWTKFAVKEELWNVFEDVSNPDAPIKKENIKWKYLTNENSTTSNG